MLFLRFAWFDICKLHIHCRLRTRYTIEIFFLRKFSTWKKYGLYLFVSSISSRINISRNFDMQHNFEAHIFSTILSPNILYDRKQFCYRLLSVFPEEEERKNCMAQLLTQTKSKLLDFSFFLQGVDETFL